MEPWARTAFPPGIGGRVQRAPDAAPWTVGARFWENSGITPDAVTSSIVTASGKSNRKKKTRKKKKTQKKPSGPHAGRVTPKSSKTTAAGPGAIGFGQVGFLGPAEMVRGLDPSEVVETPTFARREIRAMETTMGEGLVAKMAEVDARKPNETSGVMYSEDKKALLVARGLNPTIDDLEFFGAGRIL